MKKIMCIQLIVVFLFPCLFVLTSVCLNAQDNKYNKEYIAQRSKDLLEQIEKDRKDTLEQFEMDIIKESNELLDLSGLDTNDPEIQFAIGAEYIKINNKDEAFKWFLKSAKQGYVKAQHNTALCYHQGTGTSMNQQESEKWFTKAAKQGYAESQYNLGTGYYQERRFEEAFKWFLKAAEQGIPEAQYNLGICYGKGEGVQQDTQKAIEWLTKASNNGLAVAAIQLEMIKTQQDNTGGVTGKAIVKGFSRAAYYIFLAIIIMIWNFLKWIFSLLFGSKQEEIENQQESETRDTE